MLVALLHDPIDRADMLAYAARARGVTLTDSFAPALHLIQETSAQGFLVDIEYLHQIRAATSLGVWLAAQPGARQLVVRCSAKWRHSQHLAELRFWPCDFHVSLREFAPLATHLQTCGTWWPQCGVAQLLRRVVPRAPKGMECDIALLLTRLVRLTGEHEVAVAFGVKEKAIRTRLARVRVNCPKLPAFARLNAGVVAHEALWALERGGVDEHLIPDHVGLSDRKALDLYFKRNVNATFRQLLQSGGVIAIEPMLVEWFATRE